MAGLGIARAIFIGTSMGGVITVATAAKRRTAVAGAILNDVGPVASPEGLARIAGYAGKPVQIEPWGDAEAYLRAVNCGAKLGPLSEITCIQAARAS